ATVAWLALLSVPDSLTVWATAARVTVARRYCGPEPPVIAYAAPPPPATTATPTTPATTRRRRPGSPIRASPGTTADEPADRATAVDRLAELDTGGRHGPRAVGLAERVGTAPHLQRRARGRTRHGVFRGHRHRDGPGGGS